MWKKGAGVINDMVIVSVEMKNKFSFPAPTTKLILISWSKNDGLSFGSMVSSVKSLYVTANVEEALPKISHSDQETELPT